MTAAAESPPSMARDALSRGQVRAEKQVTNKGPNCNSQHDPPVVSHKEQPEGVSHSFAISGRSTYMMKKL